MQLPAAPRTALSRSVDLTLKLIRRQFAAHCIHTITKTGAGSGNRTRVTSLEGWCSTSELYPPRHGAGLKRCMKLVEGGGFEPPKLARQIYSLIPLATREPLLQEPQYHSRNLGVLIRGGILRELIILCNRLAEFF